MSLFTHFTEVIPNSDNTTCVCLLVCLKKPQTLSSDEWLFFFRKMTATFSANEMMKKCVLSLAAKNIHFVLTAHDGI